MNEPKKYVIEKEGYSSIVVSMTKREAKIIEKFLEWAVIEDDIVLGGEQMGFTIDDAIDKCKDRANISALHHMPTTSDEWSRMAHWLENLRDASSTIQVADFKHEPYYPGDNVFDMRDKEHDATIEQVCEILDRLSE